MKINKINLYLCATGTWFLSFGIQMVVFTWLITIELNESPTRVGVAQMALLLPTLIFILIGGSLSDRYGGRLIAIIGQSCAATGPIGLAVVIYSGWLTFETIILFALWMGAAQALVTPARDGLLARLAEGQVQKLVIKVSMAQFGIQVIGFLIAAATDQLGPVIVLCAQSLVLVLGVAAFLALDVDEALTASNSNSFAEHIYDSIVEGISTIRATPALLTVTLQNLAMGMFLMGSYMVTLPLLIRQNYEGTSSELAWMNIANAVGLFLASMYLLRIGGIRRPGRLLLYSLAAAGLLLGAASQAVDFWHLIFIVFLWGASGGFMMTMSRSIMQEQSPQDQRGRIMAFFSLSFMGAGLAGSLLNGYLVELYRAEGALIIAAVGVVSATLLVRLLSSIWTLESHWKP